MASEREERIARVRRTLLDFLEALDDARGIMFDKGAAEDPPQDLSIQEAAERFNCSVSFLRKHPEIPHYRLGRNKRAPYRYREPELREFFRARSFN